MNLAWRVLFFLQMQCVRFVGKFFMFKHLKSIFLMGPLEIKKETLMQ